MHNQYKYKLSRLAFNSGRAETNSNFLNTHCKQHILIYLSVNQVLGLHRVKSMYIPDRHCPHNYNHEQHNHNNNQSNQRHTYLACTVV